MPSLPPSRPWHGPILWLTDPHPLFTARVWLPMVLCTAPAGPCALRASSAQLSEPSSPQGGSGGLTHPGASCTPVTRCSSSVRVTPAASTLNGPLSRMGPGRGTGAWGLFPGQTAQRSLQPPAPLLLFTNSGSSFKMFPGTFQYSFRARGYFREQLWMP